MPFVVKVSKALECCDGLLVLPQLPQCHRNAVLPSVPRPQGMVLPGPPLLAGQELLEISFIHNLCRTTNRRICNM